mgnify:FL=1
MVRMGDLPPARSLADLEAVVSDTKDPIYPIHRNATPPDLFRTLNSVLFDVKSKMVSVWNGQKASGGKPTLRIDWRSLGVQWVTPPFGARR